MNSENFDEEGLLKNMQLSKLALKISKLTFDWNNHSDPVIDANGLLNEVRKLSLEISEYEQRMGSNLSKWAITPFIFENNQSHLIYKRDYR